MDLYLRQCPDLNVADTMLNNEIIVDQGDNYHTQISHLTRSKICLLCIFIYLKIFFVKLL